MGLLKLLLIWLIFINIITYIIYAIDKYKSMHHKWRIRESTLILLAVIGGSVGALLAMYTVRHKTKHNKFRIGVPVILAVQIIVVCGLYSIKINVIAKYERNSGCTGAIQESYSISVFKT